MRVKVYSTPSCPYCVLAKKYLSSKNIQFEDVDVSSNHEAAAEMISKSNQRGVPVIEIDNNILIGFDKERINNLLDLQD